MENSLWFNQAGETYNGISCEEIYGGCPVTQGGQSIVDNNPPVPVSAAIPPPYRAESGGNSELSALPDELGLPGDRGNVNGDGYDPGYLQVLADGSVVDANGMVYSSGTSEGLDPVQPILQAGQRVEQCHFGCPQGTPSELGCAPSNHCKYGTVTGVMQKSLPPKYEIIWDSGMTGFFLASDVEISGDLIVSGEENPMSNQIFPPITDPLGLPPVVVVDNGFKERPLGANILRCGKDKYTLPIQIGEEKCIDKTIALVLGAIAIYYVMTKD